MHYEGLNLLNEKLRFPCSLRHINRKKKKIKTAEREEQPSRRRQKSGVDTPRRRAGSYLPTYIHCSTAVAERRRRKRKKIKAVSQYYTVVYTPNRTSTCLCLCVFMCGGLK